MLSILRHKKRLIYTLDVIAFPEVVLRAETEMKMCRWRR